MFLVLYKKQDFLLWKTNVPIQNIALTENDDLIGENTDVFGFQAGYLKTLTNQEKKNKKALIIGAGGVSPSIILALIKSEIKEIYITNRTYEKSLFLKLTVDPKVT